MKYKLKALSMRSVNQSDEVVVWFKGPFFYKINEGNRKFVFPWNVKQITVNSINSFPIYFWGLKGKRELTIQEVTNDVKVWNPDEKWKQSTKTELSEIATENIINQFQCELTTELTEMNALLQQNIEIKPINLSSLTDLHVPESICTIPKK